MTNRTNISRKLIGVCHLLELGGSDGSYYMNYHRLSRAQELLSEICEEAGEVEEMKTKELRTMERLENYVTQVLEEDSDKHMSDLENVTEIISSGFAKKINEPDDFEGYRPEKKKYAEEIGLNIRVRGSA